MSSYTFKYNCDVCDAKPIIRETGMCSVCTFGEADSMWEWLWEQDEFSKKERELAVEYVFEGIFAETELFDKKGNVNPIVAMLLHVNQDVLDKVEELLDEQTKA